MKCRLFRTLPRYTLAVSLCMPFLMGQTQCNPSVNVPDVVSMTQATAQSTIVGAGLTVGTVTKKQSDTVPAGRVISQDPSAGTAVPPGSAVHLTVSLGVATATVPNVVGMTQSAAQSAIISADLTVGAVTNQYSDTVPAGSVISQSPVGGTHVAPGSAVALTVSLGGASVSVPNVVGMAQLSAESAIVGAGLAVGAIAEEYSSTAPEGTVTRQYPVAGTTVPSGSSVDLVVSLGDPFSAVYYEFALAWAGFDRPQGVAVDGLGTVYVADSYNHRIQTFDSDGVLLLTWGSEGAGDGEFSWPSGVAADDAGNVYVADYGNHRVQVFDAEGVFLNSWGTYGAENGQLAWPHGLAVDSLGNVYVADTENHRIQVFDAQGAFLATWGGYGTDYGQFIRPYGVAVDAYGDVYVVDYENHRVQIFDSDGAFLDVLGAFGSGFAQFAYPHGLAVDLAGNIYVADTFNSRVQKFSSAGVFLSSWGTEGQQNGQLSYPQGVAVDGTGYVYVSDTENNRIQKFRPVIGKKDAQGIR